MHDVMLKQPMEVVDITSPAMNSMLGRYFIGQTGELCFGNCFNAWGGIVNPINSGVNLYFDIFTITKDGIKKVVEQEILPEYKESKKQ